MRIFKFGLEGNESKNCSLFGFVELEKFITTIIIFGRIHDSEILYRN